MSRSFPSNFLWGAATSCYQIEGAVHEDGRVPSIWDTFSHTAGKTDNGDNGDVACDHYHRYADDIALMAELGLPAYRFSIAWPRVMSEDGVNHRGLDFYRKVVDGLLARGSKPCATLYHWDLPQFIEDRGGWPARDTAQRFAEYAQVVFDALGDRVPMWITHNEPWCAAFLGYYRGLHAPGMRDLGQALAASHHLLLSHGLAMQAMRAAAKPAALGITLNLSPTHATQPGDEDAARLADGYFNRWFLDPVLRGVYPDDVFTQAREFVRPGDLDTIHVPLDFLGVNYYFRTVVTKSDEELGWREAAPGEPRTAMGWEIGPQHLSELLVRLENEYGPDLPLYVTENGAAFDDTVSEDGSIDDPQRVDFLRRHFAAGLDAIERGVNLRGWFVWSLLDNFEWAYGYDKRFGIVYVDYATQRRTPKSSARWLSRVVAVNGLR